MAAPGALSVAHDPARTRAPAAAGDALARPVRVRLSARGARVARDGADVVRHGPTRNRTENLLIKSADARGDHRALAGTYTYNSPGLGGCRDLPSTRRPFSNLSARAHTTRRPRDP